MVEGIIKLVVVFVVAWFAIFCILLKPHVWVKQTGVRLDARAKVKYHFSWTGATPSIIVSKIIWSFIGVVMLTYALTLILPIFWMLYSSLKSWQAWTFSAFTLPGFYKVEGAPQVLLDDLNRICWDNYLIAFSRIRVDEGKNSYDMWDMLFNSVLTSVWEPFKSVFWMTVTAYVMARCKFPGNKFLYNYGIVLMIVPIYGTGAANMILMNKLGLYNNLYVAELVLQPATTWSGMNFLVLYGALKAIPMTYTEAAELDGASKLTIMFKIIIPMVLPTCATFYLLGFINTWNAYENFLIMYPDFPNIAYGVYRFQATAWTGGANVALSKPQVFAGIVIVMIFPLILYLSFQKIIRSKFTVGGLKG